MAVSRVKTSSVLQGFPKYRSMLGGNAAYNPTSYESIATVSGDASASTITFSSIASTYKSLQLRFTGQSTASGDLTLTINGSSLTYSHHLYGDGATVTANSTASACPLNKSVTAAATYPYVGIIDLIDYASTSKTKTVRFMTGVDKNGSGEIVLGSGFLNSTSAVTSLSITTSGTSFTTNARFSLYGIKGA